MHVVSDQVWGENASFYYILYMQIIDLYISCPHALAYLDHFT